MPDGSAGRRAARDLVALGWSAPLRAAYEVSKRLGGHRAVFGFLARKGVGDRVRQSPLRWAHGVPAAAVDRVTHDAAEILAGKIRLFGKERLLGSPPDWHSTIVAPGEWVNLPWWKLDLGGDRSEADVKWVWELGRSRHLAVLARASRFTERPEYQHALEAHLRSWLSQNPPEKGVHWYSNLEVALRCLVFSEVLDRAEPRLGSDITLGLSDALWRSGRHLTADLPYTLSTMRNNHLLGDGLGMEVVGQSFPLEGTARRWARVGRWLFERQAARHFRPDGSMIEDSLSYHRFVLEMLVVRHLLGGPVDSAPIEPSAQMLARMGVLDGAVPQYGDWDEGRVLVSTQDPHDLSGSVRAALAAAGSGAPSEWRELHDECAWYTEEGEPADPQPAEINGRDVGGGIARAARGVFTVWLKAGSGPSHGHADLCSTAVLVDGEWIIGDPGTGAYNGPIDQRNYFRASIAHSVIRPMGRDQLEPHRAFRWRHTASGRVGPPLALGDRLVMWGVHDAYARLQPPRMVVRAVLFAERSLLVADWVQGPPGAPFALSLPLGPNATWEPTSSTIRLSSGRRLALRVPGSLSSVRGQEEPFDGWWSDTYGSKQPATRLELRGEMRGPVWWLISLDDRPPPAVIEDRLVCDQLALTTRFLGPTICLDLRDLEAPDQSETASLRW